MVFDCDPWERFSGLLEPRAPALLPEVSLWLARADPRWRDPEALSQALGVGMPYWAVAWAGGVALARFLLDAPTWVRGKRVVDFASGSGVVAIAAAKAGAAEVTALDIDPLAAQAVAANAAHNVVRLEIVNEDWLGRSERVAEVICAGDACYDVVEAPPILRWLRHQAKLGALVLLGDSLRPGSPRDGVRVLRELQPTDFQHTTTHPTDDDTLARARVVELLPR